MIAILVTFLVTAIVMGYPLHRQAERARAAEHDARMNALSVEKWFADSAFWQERAETRKRLLDTATYTARIYKNDRDEARRTADMYRTAFTGLMLNLTRQELLAPDEPRGVVDVVELRRGRA